MLSNASSGSENGKANLPLGNLSLKGACDKALELNCWERGAGVERKEKFSKAPISGAFFI